MELPELEELLCLLKSHGVIKYNTHQLEIAFAESPCKPGDPQTLPEATSDVEPDHAVVTDLSDGEDDDPRFFLERIAAANFDKDRQNN